MSFKWRNMINFMFSHHYSRSCVEDRLYGPKGGNALVLVSGL